MLYSVPWCFAMVCCVMLCGDCCDRLEHTVIHKHAQTHIHPNTHPPAHSHTLADRYVLTHTTTKLSNHSPSPPTHIHLIAFKDGEEEEDEIFVLDPSVLTIQDFQVRTCVHRVSQSVLYLHPHSKAKAHRIHCIATDLERFSSTLPALQFAFSLSHSPPLIFSPSL